MAPKIWKEFFVNNKKFWIQTTEESHKVPIANATANNFTADEPFGLYSKLSKDAEDEKRRSFLQATKEVLDKGNCIVCLTMEDDQPVIAGFFNLEEASTDDNLSVFRPGRDMLMYMLKRRNLCTELNINKYMGERGLYVFSEYRGNGIGCELLKCWQLVAKEKNFEVAFGIFSSKYSQKAAERAGLIKVLHVPFEELRKAFPETVSEGVEEHTLGLEVFCSKHEMLK